MKIEVDYTDFSDDGGTVINGTESVERGSTAVVPPLTWHTNLKLSGKQDGTKVTSEPHGFTLLPEVKTKNNFQTTGTMTTTIDGRTYTQPGNGT